MATKGKRKSSIFCLAGILFFTFARAAEGFRLRKAGGRAAAEGFRPGRLVFGNVFDRRSSSAAQVRDGAAERDADYQGDSPGSPAPPVCCPPGLVWALTPLCPRSPSDHSSA